MKPINNCTLKTKTFILNASLQLEEPLLTLHLEDLINGIINERNYGEEDVGAQIHKKVDLEDIYHVFSSGRDDAVEQRELEEYEFGREIPNKSHSSFFKVRLGGEILVSISIKLNDKTKELVSELELDKVREIHPN